MRILKVVRSLLAEAMPGQVDDSGAGPISRGHDEAGAADRPRRVCLLTFDLDHYRSGVGAALRSFLRAVKLHHPPPPRSSSSQTVGRHAENAFRP